MPPYDLVEALLQRLYHERAAYRKRSRNVKERVVWLPLVQEPESLLRERKRQLTTTVSRHDGESPQTLFSRSDVLNTLCQVSYSRSLKEIAQWQFHLEGVTQAGDNLDSQQGVAAQGKEVVVDADYPPLEHLRPDASHQFFGGRAGSYILPAPFENTIGNR